MKIRLAFREVGPSGGGWGIYAPSRGHGLLAANDNVVRPLVKDGVAGFGAHHEVVSGRRVEINLCECPPQKFRLSFESPHSEPIEVQWKGSDCLSSIYRRLLKERP
jgi:hypothetical protein